MLTREILTAQQVLSGLTDEQLNAITTLSQNDENAVIAKKTGEIYGALDNDILEATGIAKNGTEKTYDYNKRVLGEFKTKAERASALQSQVDSLTKEKARLEKALAEGAGDAETAKALKQAKADLASITSQFNDLNTKYQEAESRHQSEIFSMKVNSELEASAKALKFKAGLPESVTRVILEQAFEKVKGMHPELIDDGKGGKVIAFKGEDGAVMRNPNNQLNPYTAGELLEKQLDDMQVLEKVRRQLGGGTGGSDPQPKSVDIVNARTQNEAYEIIARQLFERGLKNGSKEFIEAMNEAWKANNIKSLPVR